jgi:nucleoside-diphosphate-sugar epimerase
VLQAANPHDFERINHLGTRHLIEECQRAAVRHFILVSSISVTYPELSPYALSKKRSEAALLQSRLAMKTIVRPTLIYNDDGGAAEFAALVKHVARFPWVPLPDGGRAQKRPIHAADAAMALAGIPLESVCDGQVYAMAGADIVTLRQMVETMASRMGLQRRVFSVPKRAAQFGARCAQFLFPGGNVGMQGLYGLLQDAAPDIDALRRDLAFAPRPFAPSAASLNKAIRP